MTNKMDRRDFIKKAGAAGIAAIGAPYFVPSSAFGANERIVMGIIGSGGRGRGVMGELKAGGAVFSAVCDVYEPNLKNGLDVAGEKATSYLDYREMLEKQTDMDAVLIATCEHQHGRHLIDTVQAGYDSYCEKPMSHSIKDGLKMIKAVRQTDRVVQIGMQRRSAPVIRKGKQIVDSGVLGKVDYVRVKWHWDWDRRLEDNPYPYKGRLNNSPIEGNLDVRRFIEPAHMHLKKFEPMMFREWRYFWKFSGGNITDQGTHLMDVVQWYMGEEFKPVTPQMAECFGRVYSFAGSETPDIFTAIYQYPNFQCTWTLDYTSSYQDGWSIELLGRKATMAIDGRGIRVYEEPWSPSDNSQLVSKKPPVLHEQGGLGTRPHTDNFLDCVKTRDNPNAPVEIGHLAVVAPHLANIAYRKERRAYLNEEATKASTRKWAI